MTALVWANLPLCALVFAAIAGIPLRLVLTRREWGPECGWPVEPAAARADMPSSAGNAPPAADRPLRAFVAEAATSSAVAGGTGLRARCPGRSVPGRLRFSRPGWADPRAAGHS